MGSCQPSAEERERSYHAVRGAVAAIDVVRPGSLETATFLLGEAKTSCERTFAGSTNLESKATTLLGVVAGATSVLGVFGTKDGKAVLATPIVAAAMMFAIIALVCSLYILRAKRFDSPEMGSFVSAAMIGEDNRAGLALIIAERYLNIRFRLLRELRHDALALFLAYSATAAASASLLFNAVSAPDTFRPHLGGNATNAGSPAARPKP